MILHLHGLRPRTRQRLSSSLSAIVSAMKPAIFFPVLSFFFVFFFRLTTTVFCSPVEALVSRQAGRLRLQWQASSPRRRPGGAQQLRAARQDSTLPQSHSSPGSTRPSPQNPIGKTFLRQNPKKNMVYGALCRSWLYMSTPESTPTNTFIMVWGWRFPHLLLRKSLSPNKQEWGRGP